MQLSSEVPSSIATFRATNEQPTKAHMAFFARVSWPNIGPAAARPAGPAPTALHPKLPEEVTLQLQDEIQVEAWEH